MQEAGEELVGRELGKWRRGSNLAVEEFFGDIFKRITEESPFEV